MVVELLSLFVGLQTPAFAEEAKVPVAPAKGEAPAAPAVPSAATQAPVAPIEKSAVPADAPLTREKAAAEEKTAPTAPPASGNAKASEPEQEYEVDTDEEAGADEATEEETPAPPVKGKKNKKGKASSATSIGGSGGVQGSRAKNRFSPILKSETKSVYKKDGKALDVDTD